MRRLRGIFVGVMLVLAGSVAHSESRDPKVVSGSASFQKDGANWTITQSTPRVAIDWQQFDVPAGSTTQFIQPSAAAVALNRVVGSQMSMIDGSLIANGQVWIINPNGISIGPTANINVGGFVASTLDVSNSQFVLGGDISFVGDSPATIKNEGRIDAIGGDVYLIARHVDNSGTISATGGVGLVSGSDVLLTQDHEIYVRPTTLATSPTGTGIANSGIIEAVSAKLEADGNMYALAINNTGLVRATGTATEGGVIVLRSDGGKVSTSGEVIASRGTDGGEVTVIASEAAIGGTIATDGSAGAGSVVVDGDAGNNTVTLTGQVLGSGTMTVLGREGDDTLIVDFAAGASVPGGGLTQDGGSGGETPGIGDLLEVRSGPGASVGVVPLNLTDGVVTVDDYRITFLGLEPTVIVGTGVGDHLGISIVQGDSTMTIGTDPNDVTMAMFDLEGTETIYLKNFETVTVEGRWGNDMTTLNAIPTGSVLATLIIDGGDDDDTFTVNALTPDIGYTFNGGAGTDVFGTGAAIDTSGTASTTTVSLLNGGGTLTANLNHPITLHANQTLTGQATTVNVTSPGLIQNGVDVAASGATVNVAAGTYNERVTIAKNVTIAGAGQGSTIVDGQDSYRPFYISSGTVTLSGMTIQNGSASYGGGVCNDGTLTVTDCTITDNTADFGGGVYNGGWVEITNSTISDNEAQDRGGGLYNEGWMTLSGSTVSDNEADDHGGGLYNDHGFLTISGSTVVIGNQADRYGGGLYNVNVPGVTETVITDSTIGCNDEWEGPIPPWESFNRAGEGGGGVYNESGGSMAITGSTVIWNYSEDGNGGGLYNESGASMTVTNSTVSWNFSEYDGGGLYNESGGLMTITDSTVGPNFSMGNGGGLWTGGTLTVTGSTVRWNESWDRGGGLYNTGTLTVTDSTISGNTADTAGGGIYYRPGVAAPLNITSSEGITLDEVDSDQPVNISFGTGGGGADGTFAGFVTPQAVTIDGGAGSNTVTLNGGVTGGGTLTVNGGGGNDTLIVDFTGGTIQPAGLTFNGGAGSDSITLQGGGTFTTVNHTFTNGSDGSVAAGAATITYTGLEPITDLLLTQVRNFNFPAVGGNVITLTDDGVPGNGISVISSNASETVTFRNPVQGVDCGIAVSAASGDAVTAVPEPLGDGTLLVACAGSLMIGDIAGGQGPAGLAAIRVNGYLIQQPGTTITGTLLALNGPGDFITWGGPPLNTAVNNLVTPVGWPLGRLFLLNTGDLNIGLSPAFAAVTPPIGVTAPGGFYLTNTGNVTVSEPLASQGGPVIIRSLGRIEVNSGISSAPCVGGALIVEGQVVLNAPVTLGAGDVTLIGGPFPLVFTDPGLGNGSGDFDTSERTGRLFGHLDDARHVTATQERDRRVRRMSRMAATMVDVTWYLNAVLNQGATTTYYQP